MTDTPDTDWADNEMLRIIEIVAGDYMKPGEFKAAMTAALRKAKAAGLREAAEIVAKFHVSQAGNVFSDVIRAAADKLEKGNADTQKPT